MSASDTKIISDDDILLMSRFQKGDIKAFEELIHKYEDKILNTVYRYVGERNTAEDLAQETFIRVFKARHSFKPTNTFSAWLFSIAVNLCLNYIRDSKKRRTISLFSGEDDSPISIKDENAKTASDNFKRLELKIAVRDALNSLPEKQKMAVILNRYDEYSYEEIAKIMNLSLTAVKSLLFRARESLKEKLKSKI